jgi:hypothetical protein
MLINRKYPLLFILLLGLQTLITLSAEASGSLNVNLRDSQGNPSTVQFAERLYQVNENDGNVTLTVTVNRTEGNYGAIAVNYATQDGSATAGDDYTSMEQVLRWADEDSTPQTITIPILSNPLAEENEVFLVNLSNPTNNATLGSISAAMVNIEDSFGHSTTPVVTPPLSPGTLQFTTDNYQIAENEGNVSITVTRTGGSDGVIQVNYLIENDTASSQDYTAVTPNVLRWFDGESVNKQIEISISDDTIIESNEGFSVKLSNPTGDAKLGTPTTAKVTITDNDVATTLQFSSETYSVDEDEKIATIIVNRQGSKIGQVSVTYQTIDITATAGTDYIPTKGILVWASGDSSDRTFTIPLSDNRIVEGNETLQLKLSYPTGDALLGSPFESILTIVENDTGECESSEVIDCVWDNNGNTLQDIKITPLGTLTGGELGGRIENEGIIRNITLLANTNLTGGAEGGILGGNIKGEASSPAYISYVEITADSTLADVIIGTGTIVNIGVILEKGVLFENNSLIPYMADLNSLLGNISTPILEVDAINLTRDVLLNSSKDGIVGALNGLPELINLNLALAFTQNLDNGYLTLDFAPLHYRVLPVQVQQVWGKQSIEFKAVGISANPNGEISFITHTGRKIITKPVVQNPQALIDALNIFGLNTKMTMQPNGNLKIPANNGYYYMIRPDLSSVDVAKNTLLGIKSTNSSWLDNHVVVFMVFEEGVDNLRQQRFYPAAADPEVLYGTSEIDESQTTLYLDGRTHLFTGKGATEKLYKGLLDYLVTPGTPSSAKTLQVLDIEDINGDGANDYRIIYPNGDNQIMYQCANCFE